MVPTTINGRTIFSTGFSTDALPKTGKKAPAHENEVDMVSVKPRKFRQHPLQLKTGYSKSVNNQVLSNNICPLMTMIHVIMEGREKDKIRMMVDGKTIGALCPMMGDYGLKKNLAGLGGHSS